MTCLPVFQAHVGNVILKAVWLCCCFIPLADPDFCKAGSLHVGNELTNLILAGKTAHKSEGVRIEKCYFSQKQRIHIYVWKCMSIHPIDYLSKGNVHADFWDALLRFAVQFRSAGGTG